MLLKCYTNDNKLKEKYLESIEKHNEKICEFYPDAGFDLFCPTKLSLGRGTHKIDLNLKCAAYDSTTGNPISYYMYPRSSISKTPLRLANSVGIIDSGYRGNLLSAVDVKEEFEIAKNSRYFQICSPTLSPIRVVMVNDESELGTTSRGDGGFGSTGI